MRLPIGKQVKLQMQIQVWVVVDYLMYVAALEGRQRDHFYSWPGN